MNIKKFISDCCILLTISLSLFVISCNKDTPTAPQSGGTSSMSMIAPTNTGQVQNNTLILTRAKFLIEFVKLERSRGIDDCDLKEGPFVVYISLAAPFTTLQLGSIPPGTYNEVHVKIHKHTPNETVVDPDFGLQGEVGFSGIIEGTFDGVPFVYRTAITSNQEIDLDPPLVVNTTSDQANISVVVDASQWFIVDGVIVSPLDQVNWPKIDKNIKESFKKAFRDDDHDSHPDHEHGG